MFGTLCTTLLLAMAGTDRNETADWLAKLESDSAVERGVAERWLAANLEGSDFGSVERAARTSGAERERRLVSILSSSERHFDLAAQLGASESAPVARVGKEALLELASMWSADVEDEGSRRAEATRALSKLARDRFEIHPRGHDWRAAFELLTIAGDSGVMFVLDPDLLGARSQPKLDQRAPDRLVGTQSELLASLARSYSLGYDAFGLEGGTDMAWIRICRRVRAGKKSGRELLVDWCVRVAVGSDSQDAEACARSLAGSGWPAAIGWLESRWFERGDEAALSGLRLLASRGLASPCMRTPEVQTAWLTRERASVAREETARAIGALGRQSANGANLESALLADWDSLAAWERWMRLVALEMRGSLSEAGAERVRAVLEDRAAPAAQIVQALRTLAAANESAVANLASQHSAALIRYATEVDGGRELLQLFAQLSITPDAEAFSGDWSADEQVTLCAWAFHSERLELASGVLRRMVAENPFPTDPAQSRMLTRMREWQRAGHGAALAAWLESLERETPGLARFRIHLSLLSADEARELARELLKRLEESRLAPGELESLAALAASESGPEILQRLVEKAHASTDRSIVSALSEAVRVLREQRMDSRLSGFAARVRSRGHYGNWPAEPRSRPQLLRLFERRFEP